MISVTHSLQRRTQKMLVCQVSHYRPPNGVFLIINTTDKASPQRASFCNSFRVAESESEVFGWSRIPTNTGSRSRIFFQLRMSNWIIFHVTLQNWEFLLKWYIFFGIFYRNREFLLCITISTDCLLLQNC